MGVLEEIRPFVHIGQFLGLFPYHIEWNTPNNKFTSFAFLWCHPATISFILALVFQLLLPSMALVLLMNSLQQQPEFIQSSVPKYITALAGIGAVFYYLMMFIGRGVTLRYSYLRLAVNSITEPVIKEMEDLNCHRQNSIRKRTFVGVTIIVISVKKYKKCLIHLRVN